MTISDLTCTTTGGSTNSDQQITLDWDDGQAGEGNCLLFEVAWEGEVLWDPGTVVSGSDTSSTSNFILTELKPYTKYTVTVTYEDQWETCTNTTDQAGEGGM